MVNLPDSAKDTANFHLFTSLRYDPLLSKNYYNAMLYGQGNNNRRWGPFYMLRYHRDRILEAAQYFKWKEVSLRLAGEDGLRRFEQDLWDKVKVHAKENSPGPLKIRALYARDGDLEVDLSPAQPVSMDWLFPTFLARYKLFDGSRSPGRWTIPDLDDRATRPPSDDATKTELWSVLVDAQPTSSSEFTAFKTTYRDMYNEARSRAGIKSFQEPSEVLLVNTLGEIMEGSLTNVYFFRGERWVTPPLTSGGQDGTVRRWLLEHEMCQEEVVQADSIVDGESCYLSNGVRGLISGRIKKQSP